jgi:hypothetical protein
MRTLINIFLIAVLICCIQQNKKTPTVTEKLSDQVTQASEIIRYMFEDMSYKQIVEIKNVSEAEIEFKVNTEDKKSGKSTIIQGIAKRKINVDPEIDEDEEGEGYYSLQYTNSNGECKLFIRIAEEKKDLLKLSSFRCYDLPGKSNGLFSLNIILRRIS